MSSSQPGSAPLRAPAAPQANASRRGTKQRLLDAAERLFAKHGFEGTSMRAVTQAAKASVSAANYHFGSKEALLHAALLRRLEPLNRRRLEALDALETAADGGAVSVEALLEAFLRPGFEAHRESEESEESEDRRLRFHSIAAQLYVDPHEMVASLKVELFGPVIERFIDALARALPDSTRGEIALDFRFFIGVMVHVISGHARMDEGSEEAAGTPDERVLRRIVSFAAAGLRAGSPAETTARPRGVTR